MSKKKIIQITPRKAVALLAIMLIVSSSMLMLVKADPLSEKNNAKFETYAVKAKFNFVSFLVGADYTRIPSAENTNIFILENNEKFIQYDITIGDKTYKLGIDFAYTGHAKYVFFDPLFESPIFGQYYPSSYRSQYHVIDYTFDFSAYPDGLEGTLNMRAKFSSVGNELDINSLAGTGDLQNVQIKATHAGASTSGGITTAFHSGYVIGWPE